MARPKRTNADYYPHDADMRNDPKIRALRRKFGHEGYSVWVMLLETLTDADNFIFEWNDLSLELMAGDFEMEPEQLQDIVAYCVGGLKLLNLEEGFLSCTKLIERFDGLVTKRVRQQNYTKTEFRTLETPKPEVSDARNPPLKGVSDARNTQSKVKESKVNKSKVKNIKETLKKSLLSEVKTSDVSPELLEYYNIALTFQKLFIKNLNERDAPTKNQERAKFDAYVTPIRLMFESDGVTKEQIRTAYDFLKSPEGEFWKPNILSTKTLREKIEKLISQCNAPKKTLNYGNNEPKINRQSASVIASNTKNWFT